jgi:KDO2-lipid IV(A) lauroyltransferase
MRRSDPPPSVNRGEASHDLVRGHDIREGGIWTRTQKLKNDVIYRAARAGLWFAATAPRAWLLKLGPALGVLVWALWTRGRRETTKNLATARRSAGLAQYGTPAWPTARDVFVGLGDVLADMLLLLRSDEVPSARLELNEESRAVLERAVARGRGVVFITAHLGPWERMAALLAAEGFPISTVARASYDPRFNEVYDRLRANRGVRALYRGAPGFTTTLLRALRQGRIVGFPMDLPGRVPSANMLWFGVPRATATGPATIALRTRASVVVGTPRLSCSGRLEVEIESVDTDGYSLSSGKLALTQRLASELEKRVMALPHAWPWMSAALGDCPPENRPVDSPAAS